MYLLQANLPSDILGSDDVSFGDGEGVFLLLL